MNIQRYLIATVAAFVFVFIFEMLWHVFLMKDLYDATIDVWRPDAEHDFRFMLISQFLFAVVLTFIYTKIGQSLSCKRGIAFGFFSGLLLATPQIASYCYLPIPLSICLLWVAASILKGLGSGMVIAALYKTKLAK